jgi:hypothetical protein
MVPSMGKEMKHLAYFAAAALVGLAVSPASAETLSLICARANDSAGRHVVIDLTGGVVSNGAGYSAQRWVAVVTEKEVAWDENYASHRSRVSNHYVFDRQSNVLRGTDAAGHEMLNAACQKAS